MAVYVVRTERRPALTASARGSEFAARSGQEDAGGAVEQLDVPGIGPNLIGTVSDLQQAQGNSERERLRLPATLWPVAQVAARASIQALIVEAFHAMQRDDKWIGCGRRPAAR